MENSLKPATSGVRRSKKFGNVDRELEDELRGERPQVVEVMNFEMEGTPVKETYVQNAYMITMQAQEDQNVSFSNSMLQQNQPANQRNQNIYI